MYRIYFNIKKNNTEITQKMFIILLPTLVLFIVDIKM